jgi:hypothetical protein
MTAAVDPAAKQTARFVVMYNAFTLSSHLSGLTCRESKSGKNAARRAWIASNVSGRK